MGIGQSVLTFVGIQILKEQTACADQIASMMAFNVALGRMDAKHFAASGR